MRTLLTADHLLAHDGVGHVEVRDAAVLVEGGRIAYAGAAACAPAGHDERIDLGASVILPGFIDLDALADIDHLILDSWGDEEADARQRWSLDYFTHRRHDVLDPAERHTMRKYALVQLALHGITSCMPIASEIHSAWAETHDDLLDVATTASELGLRAFLGPSYRSGVHVVDADGSALIAFDDEQGPHGFAEALRFLDTVAALDDPLLTGVLVPCRIETVREELLAATAREAAARDVLVRVHALQDPAERRQVQQQSGITPLDLLDRVGLLSDRVIIAHGSVIDIHSDVDGADHGDLARLADAGVAIIHCPLTNNRYASHLERLSRYLDAGITVALGTDSFPPDLVRAIDTGAQLAKAQHANLGAHLLAEYFEAATLGGARALRRPDLGRIAVGASADLVAFGLHDIRMGPVEDPLRTLVLAGTGRDARLTMVAGRVVMRDGRIPGVDLDALRREGQRVFDKLRAAYPERDYRGGTESDLFPPVFPVR